MKLEVGMYVRFNWKKQQIPILIGKITEVHYDEDEKYYFYLTDNGLVISEAQILKASNNIIDLIEVGDYVNGFPVIHKENDILKCGLLVQFKENEIKSIVTSEQFESMQYKVD